MRSLTAFILPGVRNRVFPSFTFSYIAQYFDYYSIFTNFLSCELCRNCGCYFCCPRLYNLMAGSIRLHESLEERKISNVDLIITVSLLGASSRQNRISSLSSRINASGTGAIIELHGRTSSSEGRRLVTWRFHSSSLAKRRSSF